MIGSKDNLFCTVTCKLNLRKNAQTPQSKASITRQLAVSNNFALFYKNLSVLRPSADYNFWSFGVSELIWLFRIHSTA